MKYSASLILATALTLFACGDDDSSGDADAAVADARPGAPDADPAAPDADPDAPDAAPTPDAAPSACPAALAPVDDGSGQPAGGVPDLVVSEIDPGNFIEVFNTTGAAINLGAAPYTGYRWCSTANGARRYALLPPTVTVPALSYALLEWPVNFTNATEAGGQVTLYSDTGYDSPTSVLDFTCWGTGRDGATGRETTAETAGKWGTGGACAPALATGGSLARKIATAGTAAGDYEALATPTPVTCTPN